MIRLNYFRVIFLTSSLLVLSTFLHAQNKTNTVNDTLHLLPVSILHKPVNFEYVLDSTLKLSACGTTLDQQISLFAPVSIKNYGSGNFSTASFRGSNASQLSLSWNGLQIPSLNSGNLDFSLIPSNLFNKLSFVTNNSQNNTSFGQINVSNELTYVKKTQINWYQSYAFHDILSNQFTINKSNLKNSFSLSFDYRKGNNTYPFFYGNEFLSQRNSNLNQKSILLSYGYKINSKHRFECHYWGEIFTRNIPNIANNTHYASQNNLFNRIMIKYIVNKSKYSLESTLAILNDQLLYIDTLSRINSSINSTNLFINSVFKYQLSPKMTFRTALECSNQSGISNYYTTKHYRSVSSIKQSFIVTLHKKVSVESYVTPQLVNNALNPLQYGSILQLQVPKQVTVQGKAERYLRNPVFNDLYWILQGNSTLKPEYGFVYELNIIKSGFFNLNKSYKLQGSVYSKNIRDWIIWLPVSGNSIWNAQNARQVWARGFEVTGNLHFNISKVRMQCYGYYSYSKSTYIKNNLNPNEDIIGKQLVYVPLHQASVTAVVNYKKNTFTFSNQYQSWRFTSSDNSTFLPAYTIASISYTYDVLRNAQHLFLLDISIQNAFNVQYQSVENVPMPLRTYKIGLSCKFN